MVIMALAQTIVNFDSSHIIAEEMGKQNQSSLLLNKIVDAETQKRLDESYHVAIDEGDIQAFYDAGYKGKIYPVLNVTIASSKSYNQAGYTSSYISTNGYMNETLGTIIVDEEFFIRKFGEIKYLAALDEFDPAGIIITDYMADSILALHSKYKGTSYEDIIGKFTHSGFTYVNSKINGIIYTGYKERYKDLFECIEKGNFSSSAELFADESFLNFSIEIYESLGYSYSLNPNFKEDYLEMALVHHGAHYQKLIMNDYFQVGDRKNLSYSITMIRGGKPESVVYAGWNYINHAPIIPNNAKYIRVSYGTSTNVQNALENEKYHRLPIREKGYAHLVFSNGYEVSKEVMEHQSYSWINAENGEISYQHDRPDSFVSEYIEIPNGASIKEFCTLATNGYAYCAFYDKNYSFIESVPVGTYVPIEENTIVMNYEHYNAIFGTDYDVNNLDTFIPHTAKLTQYRLYDIDCKTPLMTAEVLITGLRAANMSIGDNLLEIFADTGTYTYALYFDSTDGIGAVLDNAELLNYEPQSFAVEGIHSMTKAVDVFIPIFELISIFLYIGVIFILVNFSSKMINDKMHEIGILKALGTKNGSIGVVFGLQVGLIALLTCGLSTLGYFLFIDVANDILIESIHRIAPSWTLPDLQFLTFKPSIALMNCALIFLLAFASLIFPMIKIKAIKPVKIIKAKE